VSLLWVVSVAVGVVALAPARAAAQQPYATGDEGPNPSAFPVPVVERPLTLNARMLRVDAGLGFSRIEFCSSFGCVGDTVVSLGVGAGFGITDDLEVGALVLPLVLSPEFDYAGPSVYGMYRFLRGDTEIGLRASITLPVNADFAFSVGAPVWFRFLPRVLLQTGLFLDGQDATRFNLGLRVPASVLVQLTGSLWAGVDTGLLFQVTDPGPGDTFAIPLGLQVGYALPGSTGGRPIADLVASFGFPLFLVPSAPDPVVENFWTIGLAGRIYLDL
jgi:hypothetical protein